FWCEDVGSCKRYAPRHILADVERQGALDGCDMAHAYWPQTDADDWCGEWQALSLTPLPTQLLLRTTNSLRDAGINSLESLCAMSARELLELRNFGVTSLSDVRHALSK